MKLSHLCFAFLAALAFAPAAGAQCFTTCAGQVCDTACEMPRSWCGCPCLRDWEFYGSALALSRVYNDTPIVPLGLLNSQEFDGDFAAGFEVGARNDCWDLRYFQVDSFSSTVDLFGPGTFLNGAFSDLATFTYDTQLYSAELNRYFRDRCHPIRAFVGLRYLQLNEQLDFRLLGVPANDLTTSNHLYGGQLGLEAFLWNSCNGRFYVDSFAKAGVYYAATGNDNDAIILSNFRQSASRDGAALSANYSSWRAGMSRGG